MRRGKSARLSHRATAYLAAAAVLLVLWSFPATVRAAELESLGKAKLGMSVEAFKAAYPKADALEKSLGAAVVGGPYVKRYVLWKSDIPGLPKPTDVEFRFWKDKLWVIIVYFGDNEADTVLGMLKKQLGSEGQGDKVNAAWIGDRTTTVATRREKFYSISDNGLSDEARAALFQGIHGRAGHASASASSEGGAAATPAANPTGSPGGTPAADKKPAGE